MKAPTGRKARVSVIERASRLHHFPHGCDVAHAAVPAHAPRFPVLLRAKPSKDGDAEPWGYGGLTAMLARPPAIR